MDGGGDVETWSVSWWTRRRPRLVELAWRKATTRGSHQYLLEVLESAVFDGDVVVKAAEGSLMLAALPYS